MLSQFQTFLLKRSARSIALLTKKRSARIQLHLSEVGCASINQTERPPVSRHSKFAAGVLAGLICLAGSTDPVFAQQAGSRVYSPGGAKIPTAIPSAFQGNLQLGNLPVQLEQQSESAFLRGLMPLSDYLRYLNMAREARLANPDLSSAEQQQAWEIYRGRIANVLPTLEQFRQPASANWAAEVELARFALLRTDERLASFASGEPTPASGALTQAATQRLLSQREFDYFLGIASVSDVAYARDRFLAAHETNLEDRIQLFERAISRMQSWNQQGAGIGRSDQLLELQVYHASLQLEQTLASGDAAAVETQLSRVQQMSHRHFQQTHEYVQQGTAPLHDLTRSLTIRQSLKTLQESLSPESTRQTDEQFERDWQALQRMAVSISDTRGRMAADLTAIHLLQVSVEHR